MSPHLWVLGPSLLLCHYLWGPHPISRRYSHKSHEQQQEERIWSEGFRDGEEGGRASPAVDNGLLSVV